MHIKLLAATFLLLETTTLCAFEIKPICPSLRGAYCSEANTDQIDFRPPSDECVRDERAYAIKGRNQPIHEAITRQAYFKATGKSLTSLNYLTPLISGVEWNDDPEQDLRKIALADGTKHIIAFSKKLESRQPSSSVSIRGHYGDMQFIHAMRPKGLEKADPSEVKHLIYEWMFHTYQIAIGEMLHDAPLRNTFFETYFTPGRGYRQVSDIFDKRRFLFSDRYASTIRGLAAGSMLHIIQDSYSASHTLRDDKTGELKDFFQYPNHDHCKADAGHTSNKESIEAALVASTEFLRFWRAKSDWCSSIDPMLRRIFSIGANIKLRC